MTATDSKRIACAFITRLRTAWFSSNSLLCVGLDPDPAKLPTSLRGKPNAIFAFNKAIIDATHDLVCAYKPQIAYFAAQAAEDQLLQTMEYLRQHYPHIPIILDAKRGDIGSTADQYALEAFTRYQADAVTVNPYLGGDSITPFTRYVGQRRGHPLPYLQSRRERFSGSRSRWRAVVCAGGAQGRE